MPWERLQEGPDESFTDDLDADVLLAEGRRSRHTSPWTSCTDLLHNFSTSRHKYWILFFLTTLLIVSLLPIVLVLQSHKGGTTRLDTGHPVRIPGPTTTPPPFMDPMEFDTNTTGTTSLRAFSPPEFSPILDFVYDYFSLVQSLDTNATTSRNGTTLEVTVYYESLSLPSRLFLSHMFFPTYFKVGRQWSAKLIPFGHAQFIRSGGVNGTERLKCENSKDECEGNLIHACAIRHTRWNDSASVDRLMRFVKCLMADTGKGGSILFTAQDSTGIDCAKLVGVDWNPIANCTKGPEGLVILHKFKERTDAVLGSGNGTAYPLPVVEVKGYGVIAEEDKKEFPRFIQTRLDALTLNKSRIFFQ